MSDPTLVQLIDAIQHQARALVSGLDALKAAMEFESEAVDCPHENRLDMSTFGNTHWQCKDCGHIVQESAT